MIGWLKGRVVRKTPTGVLLDVNGVGYQVHVPLPVAEGLNHQEAELLIYTHVTQDQIALYGFQTEAQKALFEQLIKVQGVGPRVALSILSHLDPAAFAHVVQARDTAQLRRIPGVGPKMSERLVVELAGWAARQHAAGPAAEPAAQTGQPDAIRAKYEEALQALEVLGYRRKEVEPAVRAVLRDHPDETVEALIREVLRQRGSRL